VRRFAFLGRLRDRRRAIVCRAAVELMTDYLEAALAPADLARFEAHLAGCGACAAYLEQMRATVAALGHLRADDLPRAVRDELVELYRRVHAG
jgi:anti-sigma factor RsiW